MKNTQNQETAYSLPSLRVVFKKARFQEENDNLHQAPHMPAEQSGNPSRPYHLPLFDDYRFKAKDHDPL